MYQTHLNYRKRYDHCKTQWSDLAKYNRGCTKCEEIPLSQEFFPTLLQGFPMIHQCTHLLSRSLALTRAVTCEEEKRGKERFFFFLTSNCAPRTIRRTRCALKKKILAESALKHQRPVVQKWHVNHVLRNRATSTRIGPVSMGNGSVWSMHSGRLQLFSLPYNLEHV